MEPSCALRFGARKVSLAGLAFAAERKLRFPLLADFHPEGEVSRSYHAYREDDGFSERALCLIDGGGAVFWSHRSPLDVNPGADGVIDALERLTGMTFEEGAAP